MNTKQSTKKFSCAAYGLENKCNMRSSLSKFVEDRRILFHNLLSKSKFHRWGELSEDRFLFSKHFEKKKILKNLDLMNKFLHTMESYFFALDRYDWNNCKLYLDSKQMRDMLLIFNVEINDFYLVQNKLVSWLKESEEMAILSKRLFLSNVVEKGSSYQPLANIFPVFRHRSNSFP